MNPFDIVVSHDVHATILVPVPMSQTSRAEEEPVKPVEISR